MPWDGRTRHGRVVLLLCLVGATASACAHVVHPAHVHEGWRLEAAAGGVRPEYRPGLRDVPDGYSDFGHDLQLALGYGKRFSEDRALLVQLVMPVTYFDPPYAVDDQRGGFPVLDVYWQLSGGGVDVGLGALLGLPPSAYIEVGKGQAGRWRRMES